jgi:TatD DNase family protein
MFVDTHCHLNFKAFKDDADETVRRALAAGVGMIIVGVENVTSKRALDIANRYESGVYAAVGLHPIHLEKVEAKDEEYSFTTRGEEFNAEIYERLARMQKVVAIGETGLDYHHIDPTADLAAVKKKQLDAFSQQLVLAAKLSLPAIIHCREAQDDMLAFLKTFRKEHRALLPADRPWGVMHCFTGDENLAWEYFSLGLAVSFTGLVTFDESWDLLLRKLPMDKFLVETDSPFMTPIPYRGKRNEPAYVVEVAKKIAKIKGLTVEKISEVSTNNAKRIFKF